MLTKRLSIEPLTVAHADELVELLDPHVTAHFAPQDTPKTIGDLRRRFADLVAGQELPHGGERLLNFAVRLAETGSCIGRLEAFVQQADGEVAFLFVPRAWGHGYASEAVTWLRQHLSRVHEVQRLWACITPSNERSIALCTRAGFVPAAADTWPGLASYDEGDLVLTCPAALM